jgi:CBS domain-containing protein
MDRLVADIMTREPLTTHPAAPLSTVVQTLAEKRISGLPVVDETNCLVGIISETDLMWQETGATPPAYVMLLDSVIYLQNPGQYERDLHKALGQTVGEVMTSHPVTTTPDQPLATAARLMHEHRIHRLPVVDADQRVVGILTRGDIVRAMADEMVGAG